MTRRLPLRAAAPLTAVGLALGLGLSPVQASTTPGWSIADLLASPNPNLQGVAATGPDSAWISGQTSAGSSIFYLLVEHWNGTSWTSLKVPRTFGPSAAGNVSDRVTGAASASDVWTFPGLSTSTATVQYALERDGSTWKTFKLTSSAAVWATAAFSPSDTWAFGMKNVATASGYGTPYAVRYNGTAWKRVSLPGDALGVSPLSATDIWAYGPTTKTLNQTTPDIVAMHWNGKSWSTLSVPTYTLAGQQTIVQDVIALGRDSLWALESLPVNRGTGQPAAPGLILTHWNGHNWNSAATDTTDETQGGIVSDGQGGLWLQVLNPSSGTDEFLHYSGGSLTTIPEPAPTGYTMGVSSMALIPGTTSLWATAGLAPTAGGLGESAILSYTS